MTAPNTTAKAQGRVMVVDDEENTRIGLRRLLEGRGYDVILAKDAEEALECLNAGSCDVMLIDYKMPGMNGVELAHAVRQQYPEIATIIVTAHGTISMAVQAMKEGVKDYLTKPVNPEELLVTLGRVLEHKRLSEEVDELRRELAERYELQNIVGRSQPMLRVFETIDKASKSDVTVFIQGETGTGKDLVARAIHHSSGRSDRPFLAVSCVAFQESVLESELFGHVQGAFTGAIRDKPGRFELADKGTLFLDDIDLMPPACQAKLLRVLEQRTFERVGGTESVTVDIRLISCSNKDLEREVAEGRFRQDLYHRIKVLSISVPPLRERKEDIPLLARRFVEHACEQHGRDPAEISPSVMRRFFLYDWSGNVRELENAIQSAIVLADGDSIDVQHIPEAIQKIASDESDDLAPLPGDDLRLGANLDAFERNLILQAMSRAEHNQMKAAKLLGISPRTLRNKVQKHRLRS